MSSATLICHDCSKTHYYEATEQSTDDMILESQKLIEWLRFHQGDELGVEVTG